MLEDHAENHRLDARNMGPMQTEINLIGIVQPHSGNYTHCTWTLVFKCDWGYHDGITGQQ